MHTCFIAVNFSIHTGEGGGVRKVYTFMRGAAQKVCLQSGRGSKKFSILIFPIFLPPPLPINNDHSLSKLSLVNPFSSNFQNFIVII
jgi:hypothetical protein